MTEQNRKNSSTEKNSYNGEKLGEGNENKKMRTDSRGKPFCGLPVPSYLSLLVYFFWELMTVFAL